MVVSKLVAVASFWSMYIFNSISKVNTYVAVSGSKSQRGPFAKSSLGLTASLVVGVVFVFWQASLAW